MKKHIETSILISATPQKVWSILTAFDTYPDWNPFVASLQGTPTPGCKITVKLPGMTFTPTVLVFDTHREFRWLGKLWLKGLFDGEHYFKLKDNGNGTTTFIHGEHFNGLLVPLFNRMLERKTKPGFEQMNEKLRQRSEQ